jgi:glycogen debranching enzyme
MINFKLALLVSGTILAFTQNIYSQSKIERKDIEVNFKGDAQIEVGNHYMGVEFHHSFPIPQRISFFYPVANSIDLSNDYWKRDSTFIMALGLKENNNETEWLHTKSFQFNLTPYSVSFTIQDSTKEVKINYDFCNDKPAMVQSIEIKNITDKNKTYHIYSELQTSLKTSHTYKHISEAKTEYDSETKTLYTNFNDHEVQYAQIFVSNSGENPIYFSGKSSIADFNEREWWGDEKLLKVSPNKSSFGNSVIPAAGFIYQKTVQPGEKIVITQLIGSTKKNEAKELVKILQKGYRKEIQNYEDYILREVNENLFLTGDPVLDQSIGWAKALLAVNQHYIDGTIQPMPCPAEYNFYFTHDVLLTDLAVVKFDLKRVKKDLQFIIDYANEDKVIPHAYYWKDSSFKTEFVTTDGWNHFWFIILSAKYFQNSSDTAFANELYPYVKKSLEESLAGEQEGLMFAYRPDWWDIGRNYGPRSYMTLLAVKSIKDFILFSERLGKNENELIKYSVLADKMQNQLNEKLWSDERKYLINYFEDGSEDPHYYMGSLLAIYFDLLDEKRAKELIKTAEKYLLDKELGIYTVFPMDFHQLTDFFKFAGNEAGEPHKYINGGIWPHSNAWYALALIKTGDKRKAMEFIKKTMTLDGIINSPNGQPAMYEYRNSNYKDPEVYGKIDKPQFMWAAGWYLYCIYELKDDF